ncbi:MAG: YdbH domain-containing protein [Sphingomonadaceae bacterium]|nr:YdbH domain-containing protein [Sphingomonadaceae bacterium]
MAEAEIDNPENSLVARLLPRRKRWWATLGASLFLLGGLVLLWAERERIADDVVAEQLRKYDIPASYKIESIGPDRQVLTDIVIGDPRRPDLTIERAVVRLRYGFGLPAIGAVELTRPRLFATYREGKLSFGSLDPLVYAESDQPPGLPDLDLTLVDGRALVETGYGPVGIYADGKGWLPGGFSGNLAASAPEFAAGGCEATGATLFGALTTATGQATFKGPMRLRNLRCRDLGLALGASSLSLEATASPDFERFDAQARLALGQADAAGASLASTGGDIEASFTPTGVDARFTLEGKQLRHEQAGVAALMLDGALRSRQDADRVTFDGKLAGEGIAAGPGLDRALAGLAVTGAGTLVEPLLAQARSALQRALPGSAFEADFALRQTGKLTTITVPAGTLRAGDGTALASFTRVRVALGDTGLPLLSGNVVTGGAGLPRIAGRMERLAGGNSAFRFRMDDYVAGSSRLGIPEMFIAQARDGSLGFSGAVVASGPLPGGAVQGLRLPVSGSYGANGAIRLWPRCTDVAFERLVLASLELDRRRLTLCPGSQGAIVSGRPGNLRIAAGLTRLDLTGRLAGTPVRIASGPVGLAWPGALAARDIDVSLGPPDSASRFTLSNVAATLGGSDIAGTFDGTDATLAAVPLDIRDATGTWRYAGGVLTLDEASFRLEDREPVDRFKPLAARGARLTLADNRIEAQATMRNPASDRAVLETRIVHDLGAARGHADLIVAGLRFDKALQPDMLSELALGVIANADGAVDGTGRIDWNPDAVTSSGVFATNGLDFAAAFGPVRGARGTVRFTDLLNLTTAPGQKLTVESINPGIEVFNGEVGFDLRDGRTLAVTSGVWPFMGGRLTLEPVTMNFGVGEERRYIFRVEGLEAQRFVQQMELGNLNATGVFDGVLPIVFDEMGNGRIEGGQLDSRAPGGNVSYLGELTYEDMGAIANFAFAALRSLDYKVMQIRMDGPLTGEIVTRVRFDGVSQGDGTKRNFITRQIADLPIRFNVNIRAPFYQLITSIRAMYDPAFIRDPREIGLIGAEGQQLDRQTRPELEAIRPDDLIPDESPIQPQESESMP